MAIKVSLLNASKLEKIGWVTTNSISKLNEYSYNLNGKGI